MSGRGRGYGAGKFNRNTNAGSRVAWKPKTKIVIDESPGSASSVRKHDASSFPGKCASAEVSNFSPKPGLDVQLREESKLPLANNATSVMDNFNLMPNSCSKTDNDSKQLKSVSNYSSKDSSTLSSTDACIKSDAEFSGKGKQIGDISWEKGDSSEKLDYTKHASPVKPFDICPKEVGSFVKLKVPLNVKNKEMRKQLRRAKEGQSIVMLRPGMVLMKGYISFEEQISIVKTCRELGIGEGGFYQPGYLDGAKLHLKMMCLGKNWDPQSSRYSDVRTIDNAKIPGIPYKFHEKVKKAIQDSNDHIQKTNAKAEGKHIPHMIPDICIVNFYSKGGKLGLHQDKDESRMSLDKGLPVVSFSIGESAEFLYGDVRDIEKAEKVILESGDVLIFGGKSRHIFHGVTCIHPKTAPSWLLEETDLCPGRLNLTFRQF